MSTPPASDGSSVSRPKADPAVGETWRGLVHGALIKVESVDNDYVRGRLIFAGTNDYLIQFLGTVSAYRRDRWHECAEYAPEWNTHTTQPGAPHLRRWLPTDPYPERRDEPGYIHWASERQ